MEKERISNSGARLRKKGRKLELAKHPPESAVAASRFMSIVTDDVLVEILVRLPDYQTVIRCGLVCKRWSSLIFNSENYFSRNSNHHHLRLVPSASLPYTLLLRGGYISCTFENFRRRNLPAFHELFCDKSQALHGKRQPSPRVWPNRWSNYLDFLDGQKPIIRCSFQDLLFLQISSTKFCICNPLTKQLVRLPEAPLFLKARWGFACKPNSSCCLQPSSYCNCSIKYKAVLINPDEEDRLSYRMAILSSETRQWKELRFSFPLLREEGHYWYDTPVACNNGILYWQIESESNLIRRILAFDPFKETAVETERFRLISLPKGFNIGIDEYKECGRARLGVVRGRLRLSQSFWHSGMLGTFYLKAWELNDEEEEEDGWVLVHDVVVETEEQAEMYLIGLHPDDGDVFFFFRHGIYCIDTDAFKKEGALYKYKIGRDSFEKVRDTKHRKQWSGHYIELFTLVHPWFPTKIPVPPFSDN